MIDHLSYCASILSIGLLASCFLPSLAQTRPPLLSYHTAKITKDGRLLSNSISPVLSPVLLAASPRAYRFRLHSQSSDNPMIHNLIVRSRRRLNFLTCSLGLPKNISVCPKFSTHYMHDDPKLGMQGDSSDESFNFPLTAMQNEFLASLQIGSPPQEVTLIVDTGSDLVWTQCKPCQRCFPQPQPIYDPSKSSTYRPLSCKHASCEYIDTHGSGSSCTSANACSYGYRYGDYSYTRGILSMETITLSDVEGNNMAFPEFVLGCGHRNGPDDSFANASGILGLGQGLLSINRQLGEAINYQFSYCLVPWDSPVDEKGIMLMGKGAIANSSNTVKTQILTNKHLEGTYYYVALEGVSVGGERVDIPEGAFEVREDGSGGMIVDSGTSLTYLEEESYWVMVEAFRAAMTSFRIDNTQKEFDLCFVIPSSGSLEMPTFTLHFGGGESLELPPENNFIVFGGSLCLAMDRNAGFSIMGNIMQQNIEFGFDVKNKVLSMTPTTCHSTYEHEEYDNKFNILKAYDSSI